MKKLIVSSALIILFSIKILYAQTDLDLKLFKAVKSNNLEQVKSLVEKGANVNAVDKDGGTVLMWAAYKSDLETVKYLVEKGADYKKKGTIKLSDGYYGSLLAIATGEKKLNLLKYFIEEAKIDINDREYNAEVKADSGWTALQWANSNGYLEIIYYLLSKGSDASLETYLRYGMEDFFINKISENPKLIYEKNEKGENLFIRAIYRNANKVVKKIMETDIDINEKDYEGNTPLIKSIFWNNKEAAMMLIEKGADVNLKGNDGISVYLQAKRRGYEDIVELLVKKGAEISTTEGLKPELVVQSGHASNIFCMDISADGKYLISGGEDGMILWEIKTGKELKKYNIFNVMNVKILSNNIILYDNVNGCSLLELETGKKIRTLSRQQPFNISSDNKNIIYGQYDLEYKELLTGKDLGIYFINESKRTIRDFLILNERNIITFTYDSALSLYDRENKKIIWENKNINEYSSIFSSPDKKIIVAYGYFDSTYHIVDTENGIEIKSFFGKRGCQSCTFSPDGKYLIYSKGDKIIVCDASTLIEVREMPGNNGNVTSLAFTPDGKYLVSGSNYINLWDFEKGECMQTFKSHSGSVYDVQFLDKDNLFTVSGNKFCKIDLKNCKFSSNRLVNLKGITRISLDGKIIIATYGKENLIQLYNLEKYDVNEISENLVQDNIIENVKISPDNKYFAVSTQENIIKIYDIKSLKVIKQFKETDNNVGIGSINFSSDMKYFVYGQGVRIKGSLLYPLESPKIKIYDFETGKIFKEYCDTKTNGAISSLRFLEDGHRIVFCNRKTKIWDLINNNIDIIDCDNPPLYLEISPKNKYIVSPSFKDISLIDIESKTILKKILTELPPCTIKFSPDNKLSIFGKNDGVLQIFDNDSQKEIANIICLDTADWAVISPDGHFDASPGGMKLMHYTVGTGDGLDYIDLEQLKERYYEPGLLPKLMGYNNEPLRDVKGFNDVKLYPNVTLTSPEKDEKYLKINLTDRGGGIGKVRVLINGKELTGDARGLEDEFKPEEKNVNLKVDISKSPYIIPGKENKIEVFAYNSEGYLSSRGYETYFTPSGTTELTIPELYVVSIGVSEYEGEKIRLKYAAKDAEDFAKAMKVGGTRLFGESKCHITLLNTSGKEGTIQPLKSNIVSTLESLKDVKQGDILIVYLSGHGINLGSGTDNEEFYYLTKEARSGDLSDPEIRKLTSVSSKELTELMLKIPALKQVLITDVCGSGKIIEKLTIKRDIPSSQVRVFERMKDRAGLHILSGCSSDAVSYETSKFAQGLLTYSLLMGIKGAALREQEFIDIATLFEFAANKVPELAKNVGGIQQPRIFGKESFDVGQIISEDKDNIPLSKERPLILQSNFQDIKKFIDHLGLTKKVNDALREVSSKGQDAKLVYLDASEFPDAYFLAGQYSIEENGTIKVQAKIFLREKEMGDFTFTGNKDKIDELVSEIVDKLQTKISGEK